MRHSCISTLAGFSARSARIGTASLACLLMVLPAGAAAFKQSPLASAPTWTRVATSSIAGESLRLEAIVVPADSDVWAIGYTYDDVGGALEFRTLAEHLVGSRFEIVPTPDRAAAPADFLFGASAGSAANIWAVGYSAPPGVPSETLIEHWDGTGWSIYTSPNPGTNGDALLGVDALGPTDAWAVGSRQDRGSFYERPLALRWTGGGWRTVATPNPASCTGHSMLTAVGGTATDLLATGWCGSSGNGDDQSFIEHWNGIRWSVAVQPDAIAQGSHLVGLAAGPAGATWAVGYTQPPGNNPEAPLTLHLVGRNWLPVAVRGSSVLSLAGVTVGHDGAWAVGDGTGTDPPFAAPASVTLTSGAWRAAPVPDRFGSLAAVTTDPVTGEVWAAGMSIGSGGYDDPLVVVHRAPG